VVGIHAVVENGKSQRRHVVSSGRIALKARHCTPDTRRRHRGDEISARNNRTRRLSRWRARARTSQNFRRRRVTERDSSRLLSSGDDATASAPLLSLSFSRSLRAARRMYRHGTAHVLRRSHMRAHARGLAASEARGTRESDNAIVTFSRDYVTLTVLLFIIRRLLQAAL